MAEVFLRASILLAVGLAASMATWSIRRYYRSGPLPSRFDRSDALGVGAGPLLVEFTSPYCHDCQVALPILEKGAKTHGTSLAVIDASQRPDLAAKYSIRSTPTILVVDRTDRVVGGWLTAPDPEDLDRYLAEASGF